MALESAALHMVRLSLGQPELFALGRARRLPPHRVDMGYLVHCVLDDLFGRHALRPFWVADSHGRQLDVLAYTRLTQDALQQHARAYSDPSVYAACDVENLALKPLPSRWPEGQRVGFEVRACPIVRKSGAGGKHRAGAEMDVFLDRCWESGDSVHVDREAVYRDWLAERLTGRGGARLIEGALGRFRLARMLRRTQGDDRTAVFCERPDATLRGVLEIEDSAAFDALLATGIGRHKAFGFGMLRLKRLRE